MKQTQNAIEMILPHGINPIAEARRGCLIALVWEADGECGFIVAREDTETGELFPDFSATDVVHFACLAAIVAEIMHQAGNVGPALADDLGCLAHCLSKTLGIPLDEIDTAQPTILQ